MFRCYFESKAYTKDVMVKNQHFGAIMKIKKSSISKNLEVLCTLSLSLSLNIFILHRLRNKFLQLILISLDSASWELYQYSRRMCGPMKSPKVETRSRDSNLGPHDCKADALPHDHGHHTCTLKACVMSPCFNYRLTTPPHSADKPPDLILWNLIPFFKKSLSELLYRCWLHGP